MEKTFDKGILRQLSSLVAEVASEDKRINEMQKEIDLMGPEIREVSDVVTKGRRGKKPLGTCKIHGFEDYKRLNKKKAMLRTRKARKELHVAQLEQLIIDAEEFIYTVNDSEMRNILLYYCIDRKSWDGVAAAMGEGYTAEACKQKYSRFMRAK